MRTVSASVGSVIFGLTHQEMIHGDVKPQNVLIFKQEAWKLEPELIYAKLGDFGYSGWNMDPATNVTLHLPRSRQWDAPEYHHHAFRINEAKQLDIFSLGIVCLWFLFHDKMASLQFAPQQKSSSVGISARLRSLCTENALEDIKIVEELKYEGLLPILARELIRSDNSLSEVEAEKLEIFLSSALCQDPHERALLLEQLAPLTGYET